MRWGDNKNTDRYKKPIYRIKTFRHEISGRGVKELFRIIRLS